MRLTSLELVALREFANVLSHSPSTKGFATPYELGLTMRSVRPLLERGLLGSPKEPAQHRSQDEAIITELGWKTLKENES